MMMQARLAEQIERERKQRMDEIAALCAKIAELRFRIAKRVPRRGNGHAVEGTETEAEMAALIG